MKKSALSRPVKKALCLLIALLTLSALSPAVFSATEPPAAVNGTSAFLMSDTGTVMYEQNADEAVMPASTTKILTALLIVEAIEKGEFSLLDQVTVKQSVLDGVPYDGSRVFPYLADGEVITVYDLLCLALMESDCLACDVLADYAAGSVEAFVQRMNARAAELGCQNTCFLNSHGYPQDGHYTTARSLALIAREALRHPDFTEVFCKLKYTVDATNKTEKKRTLYNTNWLIWNPEKIESIYCKYYYQYAMGGKTGSSTKTGSCLVSTAQKDGMTLICVITGASAKIQSDGNWMNEVFTESERLFDFGFNNYKEYTVVQKGEPLGNVDISGGTSEKLSVIANEDVSIVLDNASDPALAEKKLALVESTQLCAPVSAGDVLGSVSVSYGGQLMGTCDVAAKVDVEKQPERKGPSALLVIVLVLLVAGAAAYLIYITNRDGILLSDLWREKVIARGLPATTKPPAATRRPAPAAKPQGAVPAPNPRFDVHTGKPLDARAGQGQRSSGR